MVIANIIAILPDWLQNLGSELGDAWPVFILIAVVLGVGWRGAVVLRNQIAEVIKPSVESIHGRLDRIEHQLYPNGGGSVPDKIDGVFTALKKAARVQKEIQSELKVLFESNPVPMWQCDTNGVTTQCNQAYLDFWGFTDMAQIRTGEWLELMADPKTSVDRIKAITQTPGDWSYVADLRDGRKMRIVGYTLLNGPSGTEFNGYVGYIKDITESNGGNDDK